MSCALPRAWLLANLDQEPVMVMDDYCQQLGATQEDKAQLCTSLVLSVLPSHPFLFPS